jgi:hypothetical protein
MYVLSEACAIRCSPQHSRVRAVDVDNDRFVYPLLRTIKRCVDAIEYNCGHTRLINPVYEHVLNQQPSTRSLHVVGPPMPTTSSCSRSASSPRPCVFRMRLESLINTTTHTVTFRPQHSSLIPISSERSLAPSYLSLLQQSTPRDEKEFNGTATSSEATAATA